MDLWEAMRARHSVRAYRPTPIEPEKLALLQQAVDEINQTEDGLRFSLWAEEPEAFQGNRPHYGHFSGCRNYFALIARKDREEAVGYHGEKLVLLAQKLGLNTCWAALTFEKNKVPVRPEDGEKLFDLIALGYGDTQGVPHKNKPTEKVARLSDDDPAWYRTGVEAALLAPTAINQQQFFIRRVGDNGVSIRALLGPCSHTDLGIVKYHFEIGAGADNFTFVS